MRVRKSGEDRKAENPQVALRLAFELGPGRVTTGIIADRLSLTQPAIYRHFSSKEEVWRTATGYLCVQIAGNVARAADISPPDVRLRQLLMGHLRLVQEIPALPEIMVMRDPNGAHTELRSLVQSSMAGFRQALTQAIGEARESGLFRADVDPGDCATLIFGVIQGLVLRPLLVRDPGDLLMDGERLLELQLRLMAGQGERN